MKRSTRLSVLMVLFALVLQACGGGGSSPPPTYDLDAIISAYVRASHSHTLTATDSSGNSYVLQLGSTPGPTAAFGSVTADTSTNTLNLSENGALILNDTSTRFYTVHPYEPVGIYDVSTGYVTVFAAQKPLPTAATTGETGSIATATIFYDTSLTTEFGTETETWTLDAAGSGANFCGDTSASTAIGPESETDCYALDPSGNVTGLTITLDVSGTVLHFQ